MLREFRFCPKHSKPCTMRPGHGMRITPHSVRQGFCVFKQEGLWRMKGVLDDLPAQDRLQIDGNTLTEGPVAGGGPTERGDGECASGDVSRFVSCPRPQFLAKIKCNSLIYMIYGGESGIRTHGRFDPSPVFKTGALNRSAISPGACRGLARQQNARRGGRASHSRMGRGRRCSRARRAGQEALRRPSSTRRSVHLPPQSRRDSSICCGRCSAR